MSLSKAPPQRITNSVLAQPIGRVGDMKPGRAARFDVWTKTLSAHPELNDQVLAGNDEAHPFEISENEKSMIR
jgi:hypothetical protein